MMALTLARSQQVESTVRWKAMGSDCTVILYSHDGRHAEQADRILTLAQARIEILEQAWSRFRPSSELSLLNRQAGSGAVQVSADLWELVRQMTCAWELTDGLYDPTVYEAMVHHGYTSDLGTLPWDMTAPLGRIKVPGMHGVLMDESKQTISLPAGLHLDPGGIGKGLAADILARELAVLQFDGLLVNLGGDILLTGSPRENEDWVIARNKETDDTGSHEILYTIQAGSSVAIATSGARSRRWGNGRHHLMDPRTGEPSSTALRQVTVIASSGWEAEAHTTAALLKESAAAHWLTRHDLTGTLIYENGSIEHVGNTGSRVMI